MWNRKYYSLLAITLLMQWPVCVRLCCAQAPLSEKTEGKQRSTWESSHSRPVLSRLVLSIA